jgi:glycosyltransferase involved in cell wall biosynthesis
VRLEQRPLLPAFRPTADIRARIYRALMAETAHQRRIDRARCLHRHGVDDHVDRTESASYRTTSPEVSVVVTLFGYASVVGDTLDSIAASRDVVHEIVVVDDHSLDDGRVVVRKWIADHPGVPAVLLGSDINRGLPASRNLGFEAARAESVMVMDADNLVYPTALRRLADALAADPEAGFAYSALEEFGTSTGVRSAMAWHVPWLCEGNYIDAQAMIRRSVWQRLGGYRTDDELVFGWEDWELWLRIAADGGHGVHVPQMLGRYRAQAQSMLSTTNLVADHMLRHLREAYPDLPWAPWL